MIPLPESIDERLRAFGYRLLEPLHYTVTPFGRGRGLSGLLCLRVEELDIYIVAERGVDPAGKFAEAIADEAFRAEEAARRFRRYVAADVRGGTGGSRGSKGRPSRVAQPDCAPGDGGP